MGKKLIFSLLVVLFLVQVVSAVDTGIIINTLPNHNVTISVLHPDYVYSLIESFEKNSGPLGKVLVTLSSDVETFDIAVWVRKGNQVVLYEKFKEGYASGTPLVLEMYPEGYLVENETNNTSSEENSTIINETLEENLTMSEVEENEQEKDSKLTGSMIFWEGESLPKKAAYYGIGIIVLSLVGFLCIKILKKRKKGLESQKPEKKQDEKKEVKDNEKLIEDAEKKIKEAQEDIRKIKNEDKINEAKRKIIEDEKELMRLREGKD
jgi:flagellar biosynthesis/type III secretory pathway M-ring protein FliF/YscJ